MFGNAFAGRSRKENVDNALSIIAAMSRSQAMIEFSLDGVVLTANENFCSALGYDLAEIAGHHHRMFVEADYANSAEYREFWDRLRRGEFQAAEYKRIGKGGREVWIQASYNPVLDKTGKAVKIIKFATDVTARKLEGADARGQLEAISKAQAVIAFSMSGEILSANANFCNALGYDFSEIEGQHHRMFVENDYANSSEYREFWDRLRRGEYQAAEYKRIGKGGREVWIQASYNPILDPSGKPVKVVKYATDITARKRAVARLGAGLEKLAAGDLTGAIDDKFPGELDDIRLAFNETITKFSSIVGQLRVASGGIKTATGEILAGANDLAERTTKQAAALEETSAAMEQLSNTVLDNAKRADSASEKARAVSVTAEETGTVMISANGAMERISNSSAKISNIIGLIDDIAFQTNLLALNASVEAARAGEAGKGFAVVAVEVRRLAQSAAEASSEVKVLVEQSAGEVSGGSKLVAQAAEKVTAMLDDIRENRELIEGIAKANQEQSGTISEVSSAVRQIDEMTQHNAALVEETNAAIEQTEGQANELDNIVDIFVLSDSHAGASAPKTAPAPAKTRHLPSQVKAAARTYLSQGNAAVKEEWSEF